MSNDPTYKDKVETGFKNNKYWVWLVLILGALSFGIKIANDSFKLKENIEKHSASSETNTPPTTVEQEDSHDDNSKEVVVSTPSPPLVFEGTVMNEDGEGLAGVKVATGTQSAITDQNGLFRLEFTENSRSQSFDLRFSKKGYTARVNKYTLPKTDIEKILSKVD